MDMNSGGDCWREEGYQMEGVKGEKNWDNCSSIVNKIYFKKIHHLSHMKRQGKFYQLPLLPISTFPKLWLIDLSHQ